MNRLLSTTRRRVAAGALGAVVVLGAVAGGVLARSASPAPAQAAAAARSQLTGVSCVSSRFCVAVGSYETLTGHNQALAESWDGTRWSITRSANAAGTGDQLTGVSCVSSRFCVAVGSWHAVTGHNQTLAESWDGTRWSITQSPDTSARDGDILSSVSCVSRSFCAAVGYYLLPGTNRPQALAESWDGTRWSLTAVPSASADGFEAKLSGVSCVSVRFCLAVGPEHTGAGQTGRNGTLAESWNGSVWSLAPAPPLPAAGVPGAESAIVTSVSCSGSSFCVAAGYLLGDSPGGPQPLAESWDGSGWSPDVTARAGSTAPLLGVSCTADTGNTGSTHCMAAGWHSPATGSGQPLIESWDGSGWSLDAVPSAEGGSASLVGVSCVPGSCAAVGYGVDKRHQQPIIASWDGTSWSAVPSPSQ
jgi:hypothetical protein